MHDPAATGLYEIGRTPEIASRHVTALCRLDLRHGTPAGIASHASQPYAARTYGTPRRPDPMRELIPAIACREDGAVTVSLACWIRIAWQQELGLPAAPTPSLIIGKRGSVQSPRLRFAYTL